ncbi:hypothetical protein R3P38DRAFT_3179891 [Favolaschia claudopus]|uniref:F-box domain-containing protein n=1 Tax=Favolaschia claudopus TaxID=2862362 RepID=A0AAW0CN19_9AGAR
MSPENGFPAAIAHVQESSALKVLALCMSPRKGPDTTRVVQVGSWRHTTELEYVNPRYPSFAEWKDVSIIRYLVHTAISIHPRGDNRIPRSSFMAFASPMGVFEASVDYCPSLWPLVKYGLLHIARLVTEFLEKARSEPCMKRQWRDPTFDRTLTRFFNGWMGCADEFVWDFFQEFGDEEYKDDVLTRLWVNKVLKGIQSFTLTEVELLEGISAQQFMAGLVLRDTNQTPEWTTPNSPLPVDMLHLTPVECTDISILNCKEQTLAGGVMRKRPQDDVPSPLLSLPDETISEIFIRFLPLYPEPPPVAGRYSPIVLTHICRLLRGIARATPELW